MIAVVVQARMSSARLPGKVLAPVAGRPLLGYLLQRLALARRPDSTIVATSDQPEDDAVAALALDSGVSVQRGSLTDVAGRIGAGGTTAHPSGGAPSSLPAPACSP